MKLSGNFVEVLKNFATINPGMVFKPGKKLRTINQYKTVMAEAEVDEIIDREFGIYDLNRLLALLSLNKANPEIELTDDSVVFLGLAGKGKISQRYTSKNLISAPTDKSIPLNKVEIEFNLNVEVLKWIFNVSSILKCPQTVIQGTPGENITLNAVDIKGEIVDSAYVTLDTIAQSKFKVVISNENIKVIPGSYNVKISKSGFALFSSPERRLQYWICIEGKSSSFE